jgi:lipopolysaccharide/colanic/teichoic acid biosynthesis glycosyltransferase
MGLKRLLDIVISILCIFFLSPIFLLIYILLGLDFGYQVIFLQKRIGRHGKPFIMYKFRTLKKEALYYMLKPGRDDPRITRLGRILRDTGLDEAPQLLNVIKGEMSFIGPRPEMPFVVQTYTDRERKRLEVNPGITGLWQLSGRTYLPIHDNLEYDLRYIKEYSLFLDLSILFRTLRLFLQNILKLISYEV